VGHIQSNLLRDRIHLEISAAYQIGFNDYFVSPYVAYDLTDHFTLALGLVYLGGAELKLDYETLRDPTALMVLQGGAFSYFKDSSYAFAKVKFGF
jgi:hypothetical protein